MSEMKTNVMRILEKENIHYRAYHYEHKDGRIDGASVAKKMGQDPRRVFKTLVTRGTANQGKSYFVFVIPVEQELDLKRAAKAVGQKAVEMIHVNEINGVTGYIRGGCSPVGMKKPYPTVLDSSAQALGKHHCQRGEDRLSGGIGAGGSDKADWEPPMGKYLMERALKRKCEKGGPGQ